MTYAIVQDGIVTNVIELLPGNASDFPEAVPIGEVPAGIGDTYDGNRFYRDGQPVLSETETLIAQMCDMAEKLVDQDIQIATLELGGDINAL